MRAIRMHEYGGPEVLRYEEVALPEPGAGEARVKIEAVGVNYIDIYQRKGQYPDPLPVIPGREAAGVVDAVGPGVSDLAPGTRVVYVMHVGSYAEYAIVPVRRLVPIPNAVEVRVAAAAMLQGLTAHYLTHSTYPLQPGDTALIHAAAGGVGLLLVQMAKRRGARVIGTVSTRQKADLARQAGADEVILYTEVDFETETRRLTNGQGVNVVYDSVGQTTFDKSLNSLAPRGYLALYGQSSGPVPPLNPQVLSAKGSLYLTRPNLMHYTLDRAELLKRAGDLFDWIIAGTLTVRIDATFPLAEAAVAHRCLEERKTAGKVLLIP
ncbi:MAG: quinone oxidoreductase [bacterium]|uniref:Quinone oxidoreductase n=1 Tax=Candidatus Methylomirabilis tolerans TaxID=3123416 RepID=A0AAJ1AFY2_9BACT|nr:quinone oxidoreductase [Candidatus Methylomirabilis sp.]